MPKAHMYWTKKPRASHWGPSQKSGLSPGSSGRKYPSLSSPSPSATPTFSALPISLIWASSCRSSCPSLVVVPLLLFLLSNLPVREESFLAKTRWEVLDVVAVVDMILEGRDGKRKWRRIGRLADELVLARPTPPPDAAVPAIVRDMSAAVESLNGDTESVSVDEKNPSNILKKIYLLNYTRLPFPKYHNIFVFLKFPHCLHLK